MWCQIQAYQGGQCIDEEDCPYKLQVSEPLLCDLWNEIQLANTSSFGSTPSSNFSNLIGSATATNGEIPYAECPYLTDANSVTACLLWCELRETAQNENCTDPPVCPYENATSPYNDQLCDLWSESEGLKASGTSDTTTPQENVTCPYLEEPSFSTELCSLWCEVQGLKNNKVCQVPCPYEGMPDGELFCQLWSELKDLSDTALVAALQADPTGSFSVVMPL